MVILWDDVNVGTQATAGSWTDTVSIRNVTTGQVLGTAAVPYDPTVPGNGPIPPGASRARQYAFTLPDGTSGVGQIEFQVTVDSSNAVFENNAAGTAETNNTSSIVQTSTLAPYADLVVVRGRRPRGAS